MMEKGNTDPEARQGRRSNGSGGVCEKWKSWRTVQIRDRDEIGNPLELVPESELKADVEELTARLSDVSIEEMEKALEVAKERKGYYIIAKRVRRDPNFRPPVPLEDSEWAALIRERENLFSQRGIFPVILTVSLAAFLQGHFQSSVNAGSIFAGQFGIRPTSAGNNGNSPQSTSGAQNIDTKDPHDWYLGIMNALPFFVAALVGAPLSLPVNYWIGRRGALGVAALLMIASSIASGFANSWTDLTAVRVISGVAMGIKAVSAPVLASETATGYWRGSIIMAWQIWVACGIMIGFVVNLVIAAAFGVFEAANADQSESPRTYVRLILGAPLVPAIGLLISVAFCYESPRFYMRQGTPNYDPDRACKILVQVRGTKLLALRDLILIRWSNNPNKSIEQADAERSERPGLTYASQASKGLSLSFSQYRTLFRKARTRNAVWSTSVVNLAQQLCGINVLAFYSNTLFTNINSSASMSAGVKVKSAMLYSLGFGAVNFMFGLFATRSIDIIGRRRWLLFTLPLMSLFLLIAALVVIPHDSATGQASNIVPFAVFIFLFAAAYSPALGKLAQASSQRSYLLTSYIGPIPFTLASESFPLSHREAGASVAIATNLFFAGLLTILYPSMDSKLHAWGAAGLFSGLNIVAFVLIYFLVEETRRLSLEDLDRIFQEPKRSFIAYQARTYLPYFVKRYILWRHEDPPQSYDAVVGERLRKAGGPGRRSGLSTVIEMSGPSGLFGQNGSEYHSSPAG